MKHHDLASASGRLRMFEQIASGGQRSNGPTVRANLRPSQKLLDELMEEAIRAPDKEISAAIDRLKRAADRRDKRQRLRNFCVRFWSWFTEGSWVVSLNFGLFSVHRRMP